MGVEILALMIFVIYFIPSIISYGNKNHISVVLINTFLGWTIIGWVIALLMAMKKELKKCPYCAEEILADAKKCKHCEEFLNDQKVSNVKIKKRSGNPIIKIMIGIIVVVYIHRVYTFQDRQTERALKEYKDSADPYTLPSGKVVDLGDIPIDQKYLVKEYLRYKDKSRSWYNEYYQTEPRNPEAYAQYEIYERIIEDFKVEHPRAYSLGKKIHVY